MVVGRRALAAGAGYFAAVAVYAVLVGIAPEPVAEPSVRIPGLLFTVILPAVGAFVLGAGAAVLWERFALRAPATGLAVGSVAAVLVGPTEKIAWLFLFGSLGWLALLAAVELLVRAARVRVAQIANPASAAPLTLSGRAGVTGAVVGLGYAAASLLPSSSPRGAEQAAPKHRVLSKPSSASPFLLVPSAYSWGSRLY